MHQPTYIKIFGLFLSLFLTQTCLAQFKLEKLDKNSIHVKYNGNIVQAVRWTDSTGVNTVILTETKKAQIGALNGYHYLVSGDSLKQTWGFYDYIKDCDVDRFVYYVDKTFAVTDLNKDG